MKIPQELPEGIAGKGMSGDRVFEIQRESPGAALVGITIGAEEAQTPLDDCRSLEILAPDVSVTTNGALL